MMVVDNLFGIGLTRPLEKNLKGVEQLNECKTKRVYAVDIPSGISATEGKKLGTCVRADETITFGFQKVGMEKLEFRQYFGEITVDDIGFFYKIN